MAFSFPEFQMASFEGKKIKRAEIATQRSKHTPGTKILENDDFFLVATIDYDIKLFKSQ